MVASARFFRGGSELVGSKSEESWLHLWRGGGEAAATSHCLFGITTIVGTTEARAAVGALLTTGTTPLWSMSEAGEKARLRLWGGGGEPAATDLSFFRRRTGIGTAEAFAAVGIGSGIVDRRTVKGVSVSRGHRGPVDGICKKTFESIQYL